MKAFRVTQRRIYTQEQVAGFVALAFVLGCSLGAGLGFILIP